MNTVLKYVKYYFLIICFIGSGYIFPKTDISDSTFKSKFRPPENTSIFLFTSGYRMPVNKNIILNSGHGFYFEGGVNPGHFISKKIIIGIYIGWAFRDGLWSTSFNSEFANDYANAIDKEKIFRSPDSTILSASSNLFSKLKGRSITNPGCETRSFHNYSLYYGIVIKMPFKHTPILKLYTGTTRSYHMANGNTVTEGMDYNIFELRRLMYGGELIIFRGFQKTSHHQPLKNQIKKNIGALSLYYETCNFYNSSLYFNDGINQRNIPLKNYVSDSFLKKYKNELSFGFKLSFCIL